MNILWLVKWCTAVILSFSWAGVFLWLIKITRRSWPYLLLAVLPIAFIYLLIDNQRVYSSHGFMHISFVYQILNGNIPPENPIFAGEQLLYPWGHHLLVAAGSYLFNTSPANIFALINICSLVLTLILIFRISSLVFLSRVASMLSVFLAMYGITFVELEKRAIPIVAKFSNVNSMPIGIVFFSLFVYSLLRIFTMPNAAWINYVALVVAVFGAGFFYPLLWLGLIGCCIVACGTVWLLHGRLAFRKVRSVLLCVAASTLLLVPYFFSIGSGKNDLASIAFGSGGHIFRNGLIYLVTILPFSIVLVWKHKVFYNLTGTRRELMLILSSMAAVSAMIYVLISVPLGTEYKFLMLSYIFLGIIGGICFEDIWINNRTIFILLIVSFLAPMSNDLLEKVYTKWRRGVSDEFVEEGMYLRHGKLEEDALYKWISSETNLDSIFVDSQLTVPVFGRRQLYVGLDDRIQLLGRKIPDGWGRSTDAKLKKTFGYAIDEIDKRKALVNAIYSKLDSNNKVDILSELSELSERRDVYVIARDATIKSKLAASKSFVVAFEGDAARVYKFERMVE